MVSQIFWAQLTSNYLHVQLTGRNSVLKAILLAERTNNVEFGLFSDIFLRKDVPSELGMVLYKDIVYLFMHFLSQLLIKSVIHLRLNLNLFFILLLLIHRCLLRQVFLKIVNLLLCFLCDGFIEYLFFYFFWCFCICRHSDCLRNGLFDIFGIKRCFGFIEYLVFSR